MRHGVDQLDVVSIGVGNKRLIANGRRMMATSWFNAAVGHYNLSQKDEARRFVEKRLGTSSSASAQRRS